MSFIGALLMDLLGGGYAHHYPADWENQQEFAIWRAAQNDYSTRKFKCSNQSGLLRPSWSPSDGGFFNKSSSKTNNRELNRHFRDFQSEIIKSCPNSANLVRGTGINREFQFLSPTHLDAKAYEQKRNHGGNNRELSGISGDSLSFGTRTG
jgi:hypothetical protein